MTIAKDHNGKRKPSWESKISVCTTSTKVVGRSERSDTPSSILSSDSDIRFTRKLGNQYRCGCCIIGGFLLFLLVAAAAVYLAYTFILSRDDGVERIFRVQFRVTAGDVFVPELANPANDAFRRRARSYRERLNLAFRRSHLRPAFLKTDILALDGSDVSSNKDLVVHFNVHFDPRRMNFDVPDIVQVLSREITTADSSHLQNLTISLESLSVRESSMDLSTLLPTVRTTVQPPTTSLVPRACQPLELSYCYSLGYNTTSYPNFLGHWNYNEVLDNVIPFRELVDSECYKHTYHFVCHILQPPCESANKMTLPCRGYCHDFMRNCGNRLTDRLRRILDCSSFPEMTSCVTKPGCVEDLKSAGLDMRVCDGVVDCADMSDEVGCAYCRDDQIHCGSGKSCVHVGKICDGDLDCPDGSDEKNCLSLMPLRNDGKKGQSTTLTTPHVSRYYSSGYVFGQENGIFRKICVDGLNETASGDFENNSIVQFSSAPTLQSLAEKICHLSTFEKLSDYTVETDSNVNSSDSYVEVGDLDARRPLFLSTSCPSRQILRVSCQGIECGRQMLRGSSTGVTGLPKKSLYGDWPWHVPLFKDGVHLCDGTLIADDWIVTTASCFQGQGKAEWVAKLGSIIRLDSSTPWQQDRVIIGMVKSPVEGSSLVLLNLHEPAVTSDFVRPICLPNRNESIDNYTACNTLGWSTTRNHLQRIDVKLIGMGECANISITNQNSICTQSAQDSGDCSDEEFAGSPLLCHSSETHRWVLLGVSNWRIGCQQPGIERPRMFDKIDTNFEWIKKMTSESIEI